MRKGLEFFFILWVESRNCCQFRRVGKWVEGHKGKCCRKEVKMEMRGEDFVQNFLGLLWQLCHFQKPFATWEIMGLHNLLSFVALIFATISPIFVFILSYMHSNSSSRLLFLLASLVLNVWWGLNSSSLLFLLRIAEISAVTFQLLVPLSCSCYLR